MLICSRTRCKEPINEVGFTIFNDGSFEGRPYCWPCGKEITDYADRQYRAGFNVKLEWEYLNIPMTLNDFCKLRTDLAIVRITHAKVLMRSILIRTSFLTRKELYRFFQSVLLNITEDEFNQLCLLYPMENCLP